MSFHLEKGFRPDIAAHVDVTQPLFAGFFEAWQVGHIGEPIPTPVDRRTKAAIWIGNRFNAREETVVFVLEADRQSKVNVRQGTYYFGTITEHELAVPGKRLLVAADAAEFLCTPTKTVDNNFGYMVEALEHFAAPQPLGVSG